MEKLINDIDEILAGYEGWMHGEDGNNCTIARSKLASLKKQLILHDVVFNEAKTIDKQTQKKLIEQIMKADEKLGLYSEAELCECGGNKRVGLDCTSKPCKHPYYKK